MKNFNILGVHWKIQLLGGSSRKAGIEGGLPEKHDVDRILGGVVTKWWFNYTVMKQFGNPPFQLTPYLWAIFSWPPSLSEF